MTAIVAEPAAAVVPFPDDEPMSNAAKILLYRLRLTGYAAGERVELTDLIDATRDLRRGALTPASEPTRQKYTAELQSHGHLEYRSARGHGSGWYLTPKGAGAHNNVAPNKVGSPARVNPPEGGVVVTSSPTKTSKTLSAPKAHCGEAAGEAAVLHNGEKAGENPRRRSLWQWAKEAERVTACTQAFGPYRIIKAAVAAHGATPEFVVGVMARMHRLHGLEITKETVLPQVAHELKYPADDPDAAAERALDALDALLPGHDTHRLTPLVLEAAVQTNPDLLRTPRLVERVNDEVCIYAGEVWVTDEQAYRAGELIAARPGPFRDGWVSEDLGTAVDEVRRSWAGSTT